MDPLEELSLNYVITLKELKEVESPVIRVVREMVSTKEVDVVCASNTTAKKLSDKQPKTLKTDSSDEDNAQPSKSLTSVESTTDSKADNKKRKKKNSKKTPKKSKEEDRKDGEKSTEEQKRKGQDTESKGKKGSKSDSSNSDDNSSDDEVLVHQANINKKINQKLRQRKHRAKLTNSEQNIAKQKAKNRMKIGRSKKSSKDKIQQRKLDKERKRLIRAYQKLNKFQAYDTENKEIDIDQYNFDSYMNSLLWFTCDICSKRQLVSAFEKKPCRQCHLFNKNSTMDPGEVPSELQDLSFVEQKLIAKIHPVISLYKIKNCQYGYSGQVINFPQNVQEVSNILPKKLCDLDGLITVRAIGSEGFKDFNVRKEKVHKALIWLKKNNPYYSDIEISMDNLNSLPTNGDVYQETRGYDVDTDTENLETNLNSPTIKDIEGEQIFSSNEIDETEMIDSIEYKDVPNISNVTQKNKVDNSLGDNMLLWPSIGIKPLNEFGSPGYISMAFPHLFPTGNADYSAQVVKTVSLAKYVEHLILYKDGRFANDPRFRFFLLNTQMRWDALNIGNVFVKKNEFFSQMTVIQLKDYIKEHPEIIPKIMFYSSRLRSTKSYWKSRCAELLDMIEQLGVPTIFFTLSSADYHWKHLFRLLGTNDPSNLTTHAKSLLISNNPFVLSSFFKKRSEYFLKSSFFPHFKVKDYWYRVEFQHRGSCHIHGVIWLEDAPDITNLNSEEEKEKARIYFDKLISCQNPDTNHTPSLIHPCVKSYSDVVDIETDLTELVNRVQRHTKCSKKYCLRKSKKDNVYKCRFGFPKSLKDKTEILIEDGKYEIQFARNDQLINQYNPWVLQTWRANIDFSPIVSEEILYRYLAKYASKCEIKSDVYDKLLDKIAKSTFSDDHHCRRIIRKIVASTCAQRDYCAQEVMYLLLGYGLYHSSRPFAVLNSKSNKWEKVLPFKTIGQKKTFFAHYANRPQSLENYSIAKCAQEYYVRKNRWIKRRKAAIVRLFPRKNLGTGLTYEDLKMRCLYHVPWRSLNEFDISVNDLEEKLANNNIENIEHDNFSFEWSDSEYDTDYSDDEIPPETNKHKETDWEFLNKMNGKYKTTNPPDTCNNDKNFSWDYAFDKYDYDLIETCVDETREKKVAKNFEKIDYDKLSEDQLLAFNHFCGLVTDIKKGKSPTDGRLFVVQGKAGYGKSFLLKAMISYCVQNLGIDSFGVTAPTGVAARNINGETIHSFLRIPSRAKYFKNFGDDEIGNFQESKKDLKILFIDEYSMVGCGLLGMIEERCREAKGNVELFGNMCVVLLGDIFQLSPIGDRPLYTEDIPVGTSSFVQRGKLAISSFHKCFFLETAKRFENDTYTRFLNRLSNGSCTTKDWMRLNRRLYFNVSNAEKEKFKDALRICSHSDAVIEYNNAALKNLRKPIARICAENNCKKAFYSTDDFTNGLPNVLLLSIGSRIMLRQNLNVSLGLVNGSLGVIQDIIYEENCGPPSLPKYLLVRFDNVKGFKQLNSSIPLKPAHVSWYLQQVKCTRVQFPVCLSWACTIHKSQSLTLTLCEIDLGEVEFQLGLSYVAFSRIRDIDKLLLMNNVSLDRLNFAKNHRQHTMRLSFLQFLKELE